MSRELMNFYVENGADMMLESTPQDRKADINQPAEQSRNKVAEIQTSSFQTTQSNDKSDNYTLMENIKTLDELYDAINNFDGCELKKTAINTVIYDGNRNADIVFIGEAPGRHEDEQGIPFCGQSGKLLDQIILSLGCNRKDVYITNTVFWRPPGNRRPTPEEIELCRPFVQKHIALLKPKMIVLVGATAVESLLGKQLAMREVRKKLFEYNNRYLDTNIKMFAIFHPSYLLRQPLKKKEMWGDIQFILKQSIL